MRHHAVRTVALTLTATVLAACGSHGGGGSASGNYCAELRSDKTFFGSISGSNADFSRLDEVFQRMHTLAADAPDAVSTDWKTLDGAITTIENAFKQAGLKPSDLAKMQKGQMPAGADLSKLQALAPKLQALSSSKVSQAAARISSNAKSTCGVDLSSS
jgi:prophage DNA circulation protein